jgi:hypothetical protein
MNARSLFHTGLLVAVFFAAQASRAETIVSFDPPGAQDTYPTAINSANSIIGSFVDVNGSHGFLRYSDGSFAIFDVPNAYYTGVNGINDSGVIAGAFLPNTLGADYRGFVRDAAGNITVFDAPGSSSTYPTAINSGGAITGSFLNSSNQNSGFCATATAASQPST